MPYPALDQPFGHELPESAEAAGYQPCSVSLRCFFLRQRQRQWLSLKREHEPDGGALFLAPENLVPRLGGANLGKELGRGFARRPVHIDQAEVPVRMLVPQAPSESPDERLQQSVARLRKRCVSHGESLTADQVELERAVSLCRQILYQSGKPNGESGNSAGDFCIGHAVGCVQIQRPETHDVQGACSTGETVRCRTGDNGNAVTGLFERFRQSFRGSALVGQKQPLGGIAIFAWCGGNLFPARHEAPFLYRNCCDCSCMSGLGQPGSQGGAHRGCGVTMFGPGRHWKALPAKRI